MSKSKKELYTHYLNQKVFTPDGYGRIYHQEYVDGKETYFVSMWDEKKDLTIYTGRYTKDQISVRPDA